MNASLQDALRRIPSVDQVLLAAPVVALLETEPRPVVVRAIRERLARVREEVRRHGGRGIEVPDAERVAEDVAARVAARIRGPRRVLNATGVVLHTNLGRARLAPQALEALLEAGRGACDLEIDLRTGRRGVRGRFLEERLAELTGAEAALVVNNNAAALVLALNELASGREVIVSRGELVEIGGSFRLPDVMARTGARLVEVGTTNRTHLADYERAIGSRSALLLKVHRSNFRQEGFVAEPSLGELVELGTRRGIRVLHDLGSGQVHPLPAVREEPSVGESLRAGVDLVTFSGDKLLGGPQAGILLGKAEIVARLRRNPLARAVRIGKLTIAALAATVDLLEDASRAREKLPVLRALAATREELSERASAIARALSSCPGLCVGLQEDASEVGGGAVPGCSLPTVVVALAHEAFSAEELAAELRRLPVPVIGRIAQDRVLLDPRSLDPAEDEECARAVAARFGRAEGE